MLEVTPRLFIPYMQQTDLEPSGIKIKNMAFFFNTGVAKGQGGSLLYNYRGELQRLIGTTVKTVGSIDNIIDLRQILNDASVNVKAGASFGLVVGYYTSNAYDTVNNLELRIRTANADFSASALANLLVKFQLNPAGYAIPTSGGGFGIINVSSDGGFLGGTSSPEVPLITNLGMQLVRNLASGDTNSFLVVVTGTFNQAYNYASPPILTRYNISVEAKVPANSFFTLAEKYTSATYVPSNKNFWYRSSIPNTSEFTWLTNLKTTDYVNPNVDTRIGGAATTLNLFSVLNNASVNAAVGAKFSMTLGYFTSEANSTNEVSISMLLRTWKPDYSGGATASLMAQFLLSPSGIGLNANSPNTYIKQVGDNGALGYAGSGILIKDLYLSFVQNTNSADRVWVVLNGTFNQAYNYASPPSTNLYNLMDFSFTTPKQFPFFACDHIGAVTYNSSNPTQFILGSALPTSAGWRKALPVGVGFVSVPTTERPPLRGDYTSVATDANYKTHPVIRSDLAKRGVATANNALTITVTDTSSNPLWNYLEVTSSNSTWTLPLGSTLNTTNQLTYEEITIKMGNVTNFTLQPHATDLAATAPAGKIDGANSVTLANAYGCLKLLWNGTAWRITGKTGT